MKKRTLILIGLGVFLGGLVAQAPIASLYAWMQPKEGVPSFQMHGLSGTLAAGRATALSVKGQRALSDLDWELRPLWLLAGNLAAQLKAAAGDSVLDGQLRISPSGALKASDLMVAGGLKSLLTAIGQPYLPVDGAARLQADSLEIVDQWPVQAEGRVEIQSLAWTLARDPLPLGDFRADISTEDEVIVTELSSLSGPLELKGSARLKPDRSYESDLQLRPKTGASPVLRNLIASNGAPDAQGWYHIQKAGKVP